MIFSETVIMIKKFLKLGINNLKIIEFLKSEQRLIK
jgi:hypothetical protein